MTVVVTLVSIGQSVPDGEQVLQVVIAFGAVVRVVGVEQAAQDRSRGPQVPQPANNGLGFLDATRGVLVHGDPGEGGTEGARLELGLRAARRRCEMVQVRWQGAAVGHLGCVAGEQP